MITFLFLISLNIFCGLYKKCTNSGCNLPFPNIIETELGSSYVMCKMHYWYWEIQWFLQQGCRENFTALKLCRHVKKFGNHWSSGLSLVPDEVGQKGLKQLHLWGHLHKNPKSKKTKILFHNRREDLPNFFEGLNSSLAQSSAEIFLCKNSWKLLDISLSPPEDKVLIVNTVFSQQTRTAIN